MMMIIIFAVHSFSTYKFCHNFMCTLSHAAACDDILSFSFFLQNFNARFQLYA